MVNVKYADLFTTTQKFNYAKKLNDRVRIGKINTVRFNKKGLYTQKVFSLGLYKDWKPLCDFFCKPCIAEIVKSKLWNRNPIRETFKKTYCKPCLTS